MPASGRARPALVPPGLYPIVRTATELLFAAAFVVGVYELIVRGGVTLWPTATDDWILPMWIAAATVCGIGLTPVRRLARRALARIWHAPGADPRAALATFIAAASTAEPAADALRRLAELAAAGTGARSAAVWLAQSDGAMRLAGRWPDDEQDAPDAPPADSDYERADHRIPVLDAGLRLGAVTLTAPANRALTPRDLRLAADAADAAGLLLRNARLTARLADQVRWETEHAARLDRSRRRVLAARDAAREQIGREIGARVGEPLYQCSAMASALLDAAGAAGPGIESDADPDAGPPSRRTQASALTEMTSLIDTAIADFRAIVHGVYPAVLTDHGLAAALDNLLADLPRRALFTAHDLPRMAPRIEAGVYFCVAALVREPPPGSADNQPLDVRVEIDDERTALTVSVLDPAASAESTTPEALRDRIEAMEGELMTSQIGAGLRYELEIPLESDATETS